MITKQNKSRRISGLLVTLACIPSLLIANVVRSQDEGATRHLWDTAYTKADKPAARAKRLYKVVTPNVPVSGVAADTVIGVTIWRLRPSRPADSGERIIVHDGPETVEWLPERVASGATLAQGDRLRVSIEAARTGYLYVIDREEYADGSLGEPYLIFPTTRTRGGNNQVNVGRVIEIPAQDDTPPYFTLKRSRTDQIGENLVVLVSPTPIEGLQTTNKAQRISDDQLKAWEKQWGGQTGRLEIGDGRARQWSKAEKEAGNDGTRSLTAEEPPPETIYYRPGTSSTSPVLVKVQLKYSQRRQNAQPRRRA